MEELTCFLEYSELELLQKPGGKLHARRTVGLKNWIQIGSQEAGPRVAAIRSVVESCRPLRIPVREYLNEILPGLANRSIQQIADLHRPHGPQDTIPLTFKLAPSPSQPCVWRYAFSLTATDLT